MRKNKPKKRRSTPDEELEQLRSCCHRMSQLIDRLCSLPCGPERLADEATHIELAEQYRIARPLMNQYRESLASGRRTSGDPAAVFRSFSGSSMPAAVMVAAECMLRQIHDLVAIEHREKGF